MHVQIDFLLTVRATDNATAAQLVHFAFDYKDDFGLSSPRTTLSTDSAKYCDVSGDNTKCEG